ncbi:YdcF family protein [Pigmentiphaga aceris]|uniref:YdcF family protein n=1 Tax=Pigmentiphaga aceris TaxID=1940612 RepID=A0A5C0AZ33_9BURK|nr:YdcF family protein [Pigmentiphaga aceris]QEI06673.1 YdcF family protein [Pigmentiphaga aceris]
MHLPSVPRFVRITALSLFAALILAIAALLYDGLSDDLSKSDVAIVLGSKVELNGQPSIRLAARLDRAVQLYRDGIVPLIIVSGGPGIEGFDEGEVMRDYLVSKSVPVDRILIDSIGYNTGATARNSAAIMRAKGLTSATVVTQYFHISRTRLALRAQGIAPIRTAHAKLLEWRDVYSTLREVAAMVTYLPSFLAGDDAAD